ncbi:AsmA-like C-terminal region-containing protein [Novacetimonas pomaceti]|uniref:AsmA-like C-terminal region-containing protein n=1 Tax=Novacetimonas pomaceti TaxID=2021998 RepID=UPI001EF08600|nr:AsmA-like C-terminal region-containing protein [Novacetimonas pomaceti]
MATSRAWARGCNVDAMTHDGQDTSPPPRAPNGRLRLIGLRVLRVVIWTLLACIVLPAALLLVLTLRLSTGPIDVTPVVRLMTPLSVVHAPDPTGRLGRLTVGRVLVGWNALHAGIRAPLEVWASDVTIMNADGSISNRISHGHVVVNTPALVHGDVVLHHLSVSDVHLTLERSTDGEIGIDLGPDIPDDNSHSHSRPVDLSRLRRLIVSDAQIKFTDHISGQVWQTRDASANLHIVSHDGQVGASGSVGFMLVGSGKRLIMRGEGNEASPGHIDWTVKFDPVSPSAFVPGQKDVAALDLPVGGTLQLSLASGGAGQFMTPRTLGVYLKVGNGAITTRKSGRLLVGDGEAHLVASFDPGGQDAPFDGPFRATLEKMVVHLRAPGHPDDDGSGPTLTATASLHASSLVHPRDLGIGISAEALALDFSTLGDFWPVGAMKGARRWVTTNITKGHVSELQARVGLVSHDGWNNLDLTSLTGDIRADGMELYWLRPIPPLHDMDAHLTFEGPDEIAISFGHAYQLVDRTDRHVNATGVGRIEVGPGSMLITGLMKKVQMGDINTTLQGNARDILALLAEPRLNVLSRHPMTFTSPSGKANVSLHIALPLDAHVKLAQIDLRTHTDLAQVHLGNVVMGRSLDAGRFGIDASIDGLLLKGTGNLSGIPSTILYTMDFRAGAPDHAVESASVQGYLTPGGVRRAGLDTGEHFGGSAALDVDYDRYPGGKAQVDIDLDLKRSALTIPIWSKQVGEDANASVVINLDHGRVASIEDIRAVGPELLIDGHAETAEGMSRRLILHGFRVGRSNGNAIITIPAGERDPYGVSVAARVLDLSPLLEYQKQNEKADGAAAKQAKGYHMPEAASGRVRSAPGRSWNINVDARTVFYNRTQSIQGVHSHLEDDGVRLTRGTFSMTGPTAATATLVPHGQSRVLSMHIADLGSLLKAMKLGDRMEGGQVDLEGSFDDVDASAPFSGQLSTGPFVLRQVPSIVRMVNNASIYGWMKAPHAPEFQVEHVKVPLTFRDGVVNITDGLVSNASLGATVAGRINLDQATLDLDGTIIPAFAVNAAPGHLPGVLGWLFSPEKNGGVVSATYQISGSFDNPSVHVNPYALLLPGFLRNLAHLH